MRRLLVEALLVLAVLFLARMLLDSGAEIERLESNQKALNQSITYYETRLGEEVASCEALRLRCSEYEARHARDAAELRTLGVRLRCLESASKLATESELKFQTPLEPAPSVVSDSVRLFAWRDAWVEVEGALRADTLHCQIRSVDTLVQVVHRVPHRFLFFRWGTKALRQEIRSKNPHTRIVYAEYIKIEK